MFRNHGSGSYPQLRLNTAWNYPQILISQSVTISAWRSPMSLPSLQSVTITADNNFINSLSLTANCGLRSSMTSSAGHKNLRVPSYISHRQFASSTHCIVYLSHYSLIALSAHLFFCQSYNPYKLNLYFFFVLSKLFAKLPYLQLSSPSSFSRPLCLQHAQLAPLTS